MKTFFFFFLFILASGFAVAGEKGNGAAGIDERFMEEANRICPTLVNTPVYSLEEDILIQVGEEKVAYKREDVLQFCCHEVAIGPACFAQIQM